MSDPIRLVIADDHPIVLVLDLRMPGLDGLGVLRELDAAHARPRVVVLTAAESGEALEAIRLGVEGVVLKDMATQLLVRCVHAISMADRVTRAQPDCRTAPITSR